jgi:TatD DNase family protein
MKLFDAHNHLQSDELWGAQSLWVPTLKEIGLTQAVVNGTTQADWPRVRELAQSYPWVRPSFGLHPWFCRARTATWREELIDQLDRGGVVGEIGLDRWRQPFDFEEQQQVFRAQLALATVRNLPVTIHCLEAWGAMEEILLFTPVPACGFLLHAYSGPREMIDGFVQRGAYFSFNAYFLAPRKAAQRALFQQLPLERLLVETDAPAMPLPADFRRYTLTEESNHPANLIVAYEELAKLRGLSLETLMEMIEENFQRFFGLFDQ